MFVLHVLDKKKKKQLSNKIKIYSLLKCIGDQGYKKNSDLVQWFRDHCRSERDIREYM